MPKQTFFNLPEDKRQKIIDVALEEFASHPYGKASLSSIVARAGIAKGSMYQYFEDKQDLYMYLLDLAAKEKLAYIRKELNPDTDFFTAFEQTIAASVRFSLENPGLGRIVANALGPAGEDILRELTERWRPIPLEFYERMLASGQEQGSVRKDIDTRLMSSILYSLGLGLTDYILDIMGITMKELISDPDLVRTFSHETTQHIVGELMNFLRRGLAAEG